MKHWNHLYPNIKSSTSSAKGKHTMRGYVFTSESVGEGHPDKVADQISDAVLDACLAQDPLSRVACETSVTTNFVLLSGEITTNADVNYEEVVRDKIHEIGYRIPGQGFSADEVEIMVRFDQQSSDIAQGVNEGDGKFEGQGAGDQGMMFGYACFDTFELMPAPIHYSHCIMSEMSQARKTMDTPFLPDAKSQVSVYYENGRPVFIPTIVVSTQHYDDANISDIEEAVYEYGIKPAIPQHLITDNTEILVNPTGRFVIGGPRGDAGLTGRKIIVDTYGGMGRHGGGAFSGKDPSKVDRSAAYYARYAAKNIVSAGIAEKCEIQIAYAIGVEDPVSINVNHFGTSEWDQSEIEALVKEMFDFRPKKIIEQLDLLRPIYSDTARYGHFGNEEFPWEKIDPAIRSKAALSKNPPRRRRGYDMV